MHGFAEQLFLAEKYRTTGEWPRKAVRGTQNSRLHCYDSTPQAAASGQFRGNFQDDKLLFRGTYSIECLI